MAPPASRSSLSKAIYEAASRANLLLKEDLLGISMKVVVAEPYDRDPSLSVAYPLFHGPVVLIPGRYASGEVFSVKVDKILTQRMVQGVVLDAMF